MTEPPLLLALDLSGMFVFAVNGALTGLRAARLDIIGMVTLGMVTAVGGGIVRDVLIDTVPPAAFKYWPYLAVAVGGALLAFFFSRSCGGSRTRACYSVARKVLARSYLSWAMAIRPSAALG